MNQANSFHTVDHAKKWAALAGIVSRFTVYRARPYSSHKKSTNKRQNDLVHRLLPQGMSLDNLTDEQFMKAEIWIRNFPGKIFGGKSAEAYWGELIDGIDGCRGSIS